MDQTGSQIKKAVPKTKEELIKMLTEKLETAESSITEMQDVLEQEKQKSQALTRELEEKQAKIKELIDTQSQTLQDKVQQTLYSTLESANKMRGEAEQKLKNVEAENENLDEQIRSLDSKLQIGRLQLNKRAKKLFQQEAKLNDMKLKQQSLTNKQQALQNEKNKIYKETDHVEKQHNQLKQIIEQMKKIRMYLNVTLDTTHGRKNDSQKENRQKGKHAYNNEDNFWNVQS